MNDCELTFCCVNLLSLSISMVGHDDDDAYHLVLIFSCALAGRETVSPITFSYFRLKGHE